MVTPREVAWARTRSKSRCASMTTATVPSVTRYPRSPSDGVSMATISIMTAPLPLVTGWPHLTSATVLMALPGVVIFLGQRDLARSPVHGSGRRRGQAGVDAARPDRHIAGILL